MSYSYHILAALAASITCLVFHRLILWPYFLSPLRSIPGPPAGNLLIGQSSVIVRSESGIPQREWVKQYGPVVRVLGPIGIERLIFMRPEALHQILVKGWLDYPRVWLVHLHDQSLPIISQPGYLRNILGLVTGYGLLTVTGDEHRQMRKVMNPAFSLSNLMSQTYMYFKSIDALVHIFNDAIQRESSPESGKILMIYDWMSKVTLDIICETGFGYTADSLHNPHNELAQAYERLLSLQSGTNLARIILLMSIPGLASFFSSQFAYRHRKWLRKVTYLAPAATLIESMHTIRGISSQMLREKMSESAVNPMDMSAKRDIMSLLVRAQKADMKGQESVGSMSDMAMIDQVLTFLGAGHETTASGLSWTLWLLANDQESQRKLRAEVAPFFADQNVDYRNLKDLKWLDCIVMESLRVMPPVPLTVRRAEKTDYIDGVLVPKGTLLTIPIRVVNTWKVIWGDDAEEFRPERWLNLPKAYHPAFSLLSFIAGPHACIGKTMAIIEMKAVLASLVTNFQFDPAYVGQVAKPAAAITMKPSDGMPLRVRQVVTT